MRRNCFALDADDYGSPPTEEDFRYTWENFRDLQEFFETAASHGRAVVFRVDQ